MKSPYQRCLLVALFALFALFALSAVGCEIQVHDPVTGFAWEWIIVDADDSSSVLDCSEVDAHFARINIVDSADATHQFTWQCQQEEGTTDGWAFATGVASYTAQLGQIDVTTGIDHVISEQSGTHDFKAGAVGNDLGSISFAASAGWDPSSTENEASVAWDWQVRGDTDDVYDWFTEADCEAMGIDYARLWVYSEFHELWWSDPQSASFDCVPESDPIPPDQPAHWTGLYIPEFLDAGRYKFEVGFFRSAESEPLGDNLVGDMLVATDVLGSSGESELVQIEADTPSDPYTQLALTQFTRSEFEAEPRGDLNIDLEWHDENGKVFADETEGDCHRYVAAMGYALVRDDLWIASQIPLQDELECRTSLVFSNVPASHTYELVVWADSIYDGILWEDSRCPDLTPVSDTSEAEAEPHSCVVSHIREE